MMDLISTVLTIIVSVIAFFDLVAIPLVFIISAIAIFSVVVIVVPIAAIAFIIVLIVRKNKRSKSCSSEAGLENKQSQS